MKLKVVIHQLACSTPRCSRTLSNMSLFPSIMCYSGSNTLPLYLRQCDSQDECSNIAARVLTTNDRPALPSTPLRPLMLRLIFWPGRALRLPVDLWPSLSSPRRMEHEPRWHTSVTQAMQNTQRGASHTYMQQATSQTASIQRGDPRKPVQK